MGRIGRKGGERGGEDGGRESDGEKEKWRAERRSEGVCERGGGGEEVLRDGRSEG